MANIYNYPLNDDFLRHDGAMVNYLASDRTTAITPRHHYDLRAFHSSTQSVTFTQADYNFWHSYAYNTLNVNDPRTLSDLIGTENWDLSSGTVTVSRDAAFRYSNTIRIIVADSSSSDGTYGVSTYGVGSYGSVVASVASTASSVQFADDILTDFNDPLRTYYLELVLRSFPAQTATPHFDLTNSFIDISSSTTFSAATTNSLSFSSSLNDVSTGGDTYLRFPRSVLDIDLTKIMGVRFRMRSIGGTSTLIAQSLRLIDDQYTFQLIDVDTKRQQLTRSVPRAGGSESGSVYGDVYFNNEHPKNLTYITRFNVGQNPTGNDNILRQFFRTQPNGDRIEVKLAARDTQSRLSIIETVGGVPTTLVITSTLTNILTNSSFYYLSVQIVGNQIVATVYDGTGISLGASIYSTGLVTTTLSDNGLVGYSFEPYNYDFTIQYMAPQSAQFAVFQSTPMNSRKFVRGATLYPINSKPINILGGLEAKSWGDGTVNDANGDIVVTRAGTLTQGGVRFEPIVFVGDTSQLVVSGELWATVINGTYRVALVDAQDSVKWIGTIDSPIANQWNAFSLLVSPGLLPETSYLHIQQAGTFSDIFKLRDVTLGYNTIAWNISPDNGVTWQPFLQALGREFSGTMFSTATTSLTLQAVANTDQGWIGGYQLKPQYGGLNTPIETSSASLPLLFSLS